MSSATSFLFVLGLLWPLSQRFVLRRLLVPTPFDDEAFSDETYCLGLWEDNFKVDLYGTKSLSSGEPHPEVTYSTNRSLSIIKRKGSPI